MPGAHRRPSGLVVVGGGKLARKPTRKQAQKTAAEGIAGRILRFEQRLDIQEKLVDGLLAAVIEFGLPRDVFQEKCKAAGLDIQIVCDESDAGEAPPEPPPGNPHDRCGSCGMQRGFHGPVLSEPGQPQCDGFVEADGAAEEDVGGLDVAVGPETVANMHAKVEPAKDDNAECAGCGQSRHSGSSCADAAHSAGDD